MMLLLLGLVDMLNFLIREFIEFRNSAFIQQIIAQTTRLASQSPFRHYASPKFMRSDAFALSPQLLDERKPT